MLCSILVTLAQVWSQMLALVVGVGRGGGNPLPIQHTLVRNEQVCVVRTVQLLAQTGLESVSRNERSEWRDTPYRTVWGNNCTIMKNIWPIRRNIYS